MHTDALEKTKIEGGKSAQKLNPGTFYRKTMMKTHIQLWGKSHNVTGVPTDTYTCPHVISKHTQTPST